MSVAVGLDIGSEAVRVAVVASGKSTPVLRRFAEIPLPPGVVSAGDSFKVVSLTETGGVYTYGDSAFTLAVGQSIFK